MRTNRRFYYKWQVYYYFVCDVTDFKNCSNCIEKQKTHSKLKIQLNKISKTNKITKATAITKKVKLKDWKRNKHKRIFCHTRVSWLTLIYITLKDHI